MGNSKTRPDWYRSPWVKNPDAVVVLTATEQCVAKRKGCRLYAHLLRQHDCIKVLFRGSTTKSKHHKEWQGAMRGKLVDVLKSATLTSDDFGEVLNLHIDFQGEIVVYSITEWREMYSIEDNNRNLMCKAKYYPSIKRFVTDLGMLKGAT